MVPSLHDGVIIRTKSSDAKIEIRKMQWRKKHFPYGQGDLISKLEESTFLIKKKKTVHKCPLSNRNIMNETLGKKVESH